MRVRFMIFCLVMFVSTAIVASCSRNLKIAVINNSGQSISVIGGDTSVFARPSEIVELKYPTEGHQHEFRVSVQGCSYRYRVPKSPPEKYYKRAGFDGVVVVQLERDFSLYVAPPDAKSVDAVAHLEPIQTDGFPILPDGANCPSAAPEKTSGIDVFKDGDFHVKQGVDNVRPILTSIAR